LKFLDFYAIQLHQLLQKQTLAVWELLIIQSGADDVAGLAS
jgi:hypothetical protein